MLAWVERVIPEKAGRALSIAIGTRRFTGRRLLEQELKIHLDRRLLEEIERKLRAPAVSLQDASQWLTTQFLIPSRASDTSVRLVVRPGSEEQSPFLLIGQSWCLRVARRPGGGWRGEGLIKPRGEPEDARWLVEGRVEFGDFAEGADADSLMELENLRRSNAGYLALWQGYEKLEWEAMHRRAKEFGRLRFSAFRRQANGDWEFTLTESASTEQIAHTRAGDCSLAVAKSSPDYLTSALPPTQIKGRESAQPDMRGECMLIGGTRLVLRPNTGSADRSPPTKGGYIFLDLSGDSAALARRSVARERIAANLTGVPLFGWLEGHPLGSRPGRRHSPLSPAVTELFGKNKPTPRQIEAIDIALNTPDIALIQGPPGTGKTRVIAALLTRLAEISEREQRGFDKNLLSSFQHDAVENAAAISGVNGLPAIKFGRKRGKEESTIVVDTWRHKHMQKIDEAISHRTSRPRRMILDDLRKRRISYLQAPGSESGAADLLDEVVTTARELISPTLEQEIRTVIIRLRRGGPVGGENALLRVAAQGLRASPTAFADDGPRSAHRLRTRLEEAGCLDETTRALLERATQWIDGTPIDFLQELATLRDRVLDDSLHVSSKTQVAPLNADVAKLLERAVHEAEARVAALPDEGLDLVLERLREDMERDPEALRQTLGRYTVVLAATCQQSVGKAMLEQLEVGDEFATVIIDEAARANPLDLLIPLSRARRRIILVGDHRQLPHMIEPDIERELDRSLTEETRTAMKQSLFQRLFEQAKGQQALDNIKRWVTLDAQYRMHPVLGRFVSRVFYERHGGEERFESPSPPENYRHPLGGSYVGKVAAWKNIPLSEGEEEPGGNRSWCRRAEARWIATEAKRLLDAHPELSVGVISFYSAQVTSILREMRGLKLVEEGEQDELRIAPRYEKTTNERGEPTERLRVGSVDAFQGKEFDVVILSFTRANGHRGEKMEDLRRKLGHLLLENRLCVAMSRQRKLLIVCGDKAMIDAPLLAEVAPGLTEFLILCESREGVVIA